jgi:hypothetical protein
VGQAARDDTVQTVQQAVASAVPAGRRLATDSARRDQALQGDRHEDVTQTQQENARGDVPEHRAAGLCAVLQPSLRVGRDVSQDNLPGSMGCVQCLRNCRQDKACEQAALIS